jgi:hypothetical protein
MWPYIWWFSCQKNRMHTVYMIYMVLANPTHITSEHLVQRQRAFFWFVGNLLRSLPTQPCKIRPICCAVYVLVRNSHNRGRSDQSVVRCMFVVQSLYGCVRADQTVVYVVYVFKLRTFCGYGPSSPIDRVRRNHIHSNLYQFIQWCLHRLLSHTTQSSTALADQLFAKK